MCTIGLTYGGQGLYATGKSCTKSVISPLSGHDLIIADEKLHRVCDLGVHLLGLSACYPLQTHRTPSEEVKKDMPVMSQLTSDLVCHVYHTASD